MLLTIALHLLAANPGQPAIPTAATCEDPVARNALLDRGAEEPAFVKALKRRQTENEERMAVLLDRLAARTQMTDGERASVAMNLFNAPGFEAALNEGLELMKEVFEGVEVIMDGKDERANCLVIVQMFSRLPAIEANADKQWAAMEAALRVEARRRGVSLEP